MPEVVGHGAMCWLTTRTDVAHSTALAAARDHQNRQASVGRNDPVPPPVVQVRPLIAAVTTREVADLLVRFLGTGIAAIHVAARASKLGAGWGQTEASRGGRRHKTGECRDAMGIERIPGPSQRLIMEGLGVDAGRQEPRGWLRLENVRDKGEWVVHEAQPVEPHGVDRRPCCDETPFRVLWGRSVHEVATAERVQHRGHESQMIEDVTPADVSHRGLRSGGESTALPQ